jgi:hypothetical protein
MDNKHFGFLSLALGLLTLVLGTFQVLALVVGLPLLVACLLAWAFTSGWRVRSPIWRKQPPERDLAKEEEMANTRRVKDALTELFHARMKQAVAQLRGITTTLAADLEALPEPHHTVGQLVRLHWVDSSARGEGKLRTTLEGLMWDDPKASASLRQFVYERDIERQSTSELHWEFYLFYVDYRILVAATQRFARLAEVDLASNPQFVEWQRLDDALTIRLRDVIAKPEMAGLRERLEEGSWIGKYP